MIENKKAQYLDSPDVEQTEFGPDMKRWLANVVDIINFNFIILNNVSFYLNNLITSQGINIGGSGVGPINISVIGLKPEDFVTVTLRSSTNPTSIISIIPSNNSFNVTFNNDPGASAIIVYQAYMASPT
jgi:hypothetical protein